MSEVADHQPVMVEEVVDLVRSAPAGVVLDATVGLGGHSAALLAALDHIRVVGIDQDADALAAAARALARFGERAVLRQARFDGFAAVLEQLGVRGGVAAVLFDLGVSSPQLDRAERGFSYRLDGPLDMRMNASGGGPTAADVVNSYDEARLADVLWRYGDERFSRRIARAVVAARPLATTAELASVVRAAVPAPARRRGGDPARRTFQALRIEVNGELDVLRPALETAIDALVPGGRLIVLAYHSGEDRIVKDVLRSAATGDCVCPPGLPCVCGSAERVRVRLLNRGARKPSAAEVAANHRAESARLRAAEKVA